jgi:hypothetical protein
MSRPNSSNLVWPSAEEDEAIWRGITLDPDNPLMTQTDFGRLRPAGEIFPELVAQARPNAGRDWQKPECESHWIPIERSVVRQLEQLGPDWPSIAAGILKAAMALRDEKPDPDVQPASTS